MTKPRLILPKRPTQYDLLKMHDGDFESLAARLVRLEFPDAFKPADKKDGGADMVLEGPEGEAGTERCWQAKHFTSNIRWDQCRASLTAAREHWQPRLYTFIFPRDLTVGEQQTFNKHFGNLDIPVDYWNGDRLQGLLTGSEGGRRVAKTFFEDVEADKENLNRAIEVGGRLDTAEDALDRLTNIGGFLASGDAFFSYPGTTHESDGPSPPPAPGSVMSFSDDDGSITSRIDVVPRDAESMERYGPEFTVAATDDETGRRAAERLLEALREGKEVEIGEGLEVTPTKMPPGLQDVVGKTLTGGTVRVGPVERKRRVAKPWRVRLTAKSVSEEHSISLLLTQTSSVPDGWDDRFESTIGGLTVTVLFRELETGGEINWNFRHRRDSSPVREQLRALTFMRTLGDGGEIAVDGDGGRLSQSTVETKPLPPEAHALIAFLEDVRTIEEWIDHEFDLPETVDAEEVRNIAHLAHTIRRRGSSVTWEGFDAIVSDIQPLQDGRLIRVERELAARIFGRVMKLGFTRLELTEYDVVVQGPVREGTSVRIQPGVDNGNAAFEYLVQTKTKSRRPPPPPPRKRGRKKGKKRRKRGR